jgi:hypothetical protein
MLSWKALFRYSFCLGLSLPIALAAQQPSVSINASSISDSPSATPLVQPVKSTPQNTTPLTARWLDLTAFSFSQRYRNQYGDTGYHYFEDGQQRSLLAGKIKIDKEGKYAIGFRASSGRSFNWAYADYAGDGFSARLNNPQIDADYRNPAINPDITAAYYADPAGVAFVEGVNSTGWEFYVRELYFSATPVKPVTFEFGSFGIEKGFSTEITTFDDDGYITGERLRLRDPQHLFFDQIALTSAYFGYFDQPNLFERGGGFSKSNYRQVAVKKQLTPRVGISGEYNWISNTAQTHTTREAIIIGTKESKLFDKVRLEGYEMLSHVFLQGDEERQRQGFAIAGEKKVGKVSGDFGFASIDRDYGLYAGSSFEQEVGFSLNGDNYNTGIRIFSHLNYKVTSVVTAFGFYTRITGENIPNLDTQGLNAGLSFDLKALANKGSRPVF